MRSRPGEPQADPTDARLLTLRDNHPVLRPASLPTKAITTIGDVNNAGPNHTMAGRAQPGPDGHTQASVGQIAAISIPHSTRTNINVTHQMKRRVMTPAPIANMAAPANSHVINSPGAISVF